MRRTIKLIVPAMVLAMLSVSAFAQKQDCTDENKGTWYDTFLKNFRAAETQKVAYDAAMTYKNSCPADPSDAQMAYMQKFIDAYNKNVLAADIGKQFNDAVRGQKYADEIRLGPQVLASDPDNPDVNAILGIAGVFDASVVTESAQYATKAISLIESGKLPKNITKDQALAYLNWTIGKSKLESAPADAIPSLLKAARIESDVKKNPQLYLDLADAYEKGPRARLSDEYKSKIGSDGTETNDSKLVLANLNQVIDRQIDAWARAAALVADASAKKAIIDNLTALYKFRNKTATDANVTELVAKVLSTPLPDLPTPITSLPSTQTSTTATTGSTAGTSGTATANGTKTPTPPPSNKPKPRRHHVG